MFKNIYGLFSKKKDYRSFLMKNNKDYYKFEIGEGTYGKPKILSWNEGTTLKIGKYCSIAEGVTILLGGEHRIDWVTAYPFSTLIQEAKLIQGHPRSKGDVTIGNDVWIGREVLILSGVNIGNGAVIGARSVVIKDVEAYSITSGNPAKHIKWRFDETTIEKLQKISWWDWPYSKILEALPLLLSDKIEDFLKAYRI